MDKLADKPEDIGIESKTPAERDRINLNHEMAGLNTGRQIRFLSGDSHAFSSESKKKKAEREFRTLDYLAFYNGKRTHSTLGYQSPLQFYMTF